MSLCRLVVSDFERWQSKQKLEMFKIGYILYDVLNWEDFVIEDIQYFKHKRNWWYKFNNQQFLEFLIYLKKKLKYKDKKGENNE